MSNLQIIARLCEMLRSAQEIIRRQAALLAMHDIQTESGELEDTRSILLEDIEKMT